MPVEWALKRFYDMTYLEMLMGQQQSKLPLPPFLVYGFDVTSSPATCASASAISGSPSRSINGRDSFGSAILYGRGSSMVTISAYGYGTRTGTAKFRSESRRGNGSRSPTGAPRRDARGKLNQLE